ncbi:MAG: glycosyltransferase [Chloroflexota bacterium]
MAQHLAARGHQIDLIAFYNQPDDPAQVDHYRSFFRNVQLIPEPKRSLASYLYRLAVPPRLFPQSGKESWSPPMWAAIAHRLSENRYDIVQLFGGIQVYEYRHLVQSLPNVIVPYDSYSLYLERAFEQQAKPLQKILAGVQLSVAHRYEQAMFMGYDRIVVLSEVDRHTLHMLNPQLPLHVIPNGIDTSYFSPSANLAVEPILLFVGNFEYAPNVDAALWLVHDIFPRIKQRIPAARLLLVGNRPPDILSALAAPDIEITRRVPDIRPYMERAAIFISPLRVGSGIKNKVLEAMAMGKPLVATPLSGDGIDLVSGTHVLYGTSADELAEAAIRLLNDNALRAAMGQANRQMIEAQFTWQRVADQYEDLYKQMRRKRGFAE